MRPDFDRIHLCPCHADHDGVDGFEVRWVGGQRDRHLFARWRGEGTGLAEVILHVARALHGVSGNGAFELLEELAVILTDDVDQNVESSSVSHAEDNIGDVFVGSAGEQSVEQRNGALAALDSETLLPDVFGAQELLERLGRV